MGIAICNRIGYNCDAIRHITTRINVNGILNGMTSIIGILIKISILTSILVAVAITTNGIDFNLSKISESGCGYDNSSNNGRNIKRQLISYTLSRIMNVIFFITQQCLNH